MALMNYTTRDRHGTYYFRRVIPSALRPFMPAPWQGKANWKRSLQTKAPADAKARFPKMLAECAADFLAAERAQRGGPAAVPAVVRLVANLLADLEAGAVRSVLEADALERSEGDDRRHFQTPEERAALPLLSPVAFGRRGMDEDHYAATGDALEELAADYRRALARQNPQIVSVELRAALRPLGLLGGLSPEEEHDAGLSVLRGHVRAYELLLKRQGGDVVETPKPSADRGPKLSEAFDAWKEGGGARGAKKPAGRTLVAAQHAVRRFIEWHGDIRLGDVTRERAREFRDALKSVPTHLKQADQKLPLREILKARKAAGREVHASTVNKSLQLLGAIVSHAIAAGRVDGVSGYANPFGKGIKIAIDERTAEPREHFTAAELRTIFGTAIHTGSERPRGGGGEAAYWLPIIALVTGARQSEMAQHRIGDLKQDPETGIWFFDISAEGGRSIKTASSRRKVPVHPALLRIGLLRYREHLLQTGSTEASPLWPGVKADADAQRAGPWSKWFNRRLRTLGITDRKRVFHSFRHTFKRVVRGPISEDASDAIAGHAGGGRQGRAYGRGFELAALAAITETIPTPPAIADLQWQPGDVHAPIKQKRPRPIPRGKAGGVARGKGRGSA